MSHTPAPWESDTGLTVSFNKLADAIAMKVGDGSDEQQAANYRVLRAAPELLAALAALVDDSCSDISGQPCVPSKATVEAARATLAKAGAL